MSKINKHIEIVRSSMPGLSSLSEESCAAIYEVLSKHYTDVGVTIIDSVSDLVELAAVKPDLVFMGMKFVPLDSSISAEDTRKVWVADYLDQHKIAYTGSSQPAHELERDKSLAKMRVQQNGLNTSPFYVVSNGDAGTLEKQTLHFPLFVKPKDRGGGMGIDKESVVYNLTELRSKINRITTEVESESLVEEYLNGREFSVAILKNELDGELLAMPLELIATEDEEISILSAEVKTSNTEKVVAVTDPIIRSKLTSLALDVFRVIGARDYGRIDIRFDMNGTAQFLEANLLPSLIANYGSFPKACMLNESLDHESMILQIVRLGFMRSLQITVSPQHTS